MRARRFEDFATSLYDNNISVPILSLTLVEGEVIEGMREGKGKATYDNGDVYEGDWKDDKRQGQGILRLANGSIFEGIWSKHLIANK